MFHTNHHVNQLLNEMPNWRTLVQKRYVKFLLTYVETNYDLEQTAKAHHYLLNDMESIFSRIEKELRHLSLTNSFPGLQETTRKELIQIIRWGESHTDQLHRVLPKTLKEKVLLLMQLKSTSEAAKALKTQESQLIYAVLGRKKPRKPFEKGVYGYLPLKKPS